MKNRSRARWIFGFAACVLTAASYAQWSNPADEVPAYHPAAPLTVASLPPILSGKQLSGPQFQNPWQKHVYQKVAKVSNVVYQLPCNCRCDRACTELSAQPAPRKGSMPIRSQSSGKPRLR